MICDRLSGLLLQKPVLNRLLPVRIGRQKNVRRKEKVKRSALVVSLFLFAIANLASACTQAFSALSINGTQYTVQTNLTYPPPVISGVAPLNLQLRLVTEVVLRIQGVSLRYAVDNQPVSPVLTDTFAWSFDTTTIADGTHSLSVLYVNEPAPG
jgi:hypothetical protein